MDREKVIKAINGCINIGDYCNDCDYDGCVFHHGSCEKDLLADALELLKEQDSLLGIQQTADSIIFLSTGTAQQGEERGILLGKSLMHEWIYKELLRKGLLTDDIRSVFEQAKRI